MALAVRASVIVPVYADWKRLGLCLDALSAQTLRSDEFEILIVNNEAEPRRPLGPMPANARLLHEPRPGSYSARNRAIEEARGEFLAFTDSDCVPDPDWLNSALRRLERQPAARVTGPVRIFREPGGGRQAYLYDRFNAFQQPLFVKLGYCVTANLVAPRSLFERVGRFNAEMMSGGDREWGLRATAAGVPLLFDENVIVGHPARASVGQILSRKRRIAGAEALRKRDSTAKYVLVRLMPPGLGPIRNARRMAGARALSPLDAASLYLVNWAVRLSEAFEFLLVRLGAKGSNRA